LFELLGRAGRVTQVSAPAGSGKTFLLRSWIGEAGLAESTAWVSVQREERNPQRFWVSVLSALRQTAAGSAVVRPLTAAPDLDGWAVVERLLKDLESLQDQAWLVIDDVHELRSAEVLRQLELLLMRGPPELRCILVTRHDVRLGLHRLRLEGEVTEIRAANLRFTLDEARALFGAAGWSCLSLPSRCCLREPRAGRLGCGWLPCRWPGTRTRSGSRLSSPAASAQWPSTYWLKCWSGRAGRCGCCRCGPRYSSRSAGN
jgi:LuxR family transcriptional regulator, maltose regulon positive regulatory protein